MNLELAVDRIGQDLVVVLVAFALVVAWAELERRQEQRRDRDGEKRPRRSW